MRRNAGIVLSLVGAFLVVVAVLAQTWAPAALKKTPIDVDNTTLLEGSAELSDGTGGTDAFDVRAFSVTRADSEKSDDDVVAFQNSSCLVKDEGGIEECVDADDPQERLLTASTDAFAADRKTALAVNDPDYLPPGAEEKSGLVNKWPFDSEKTTYPYWESTTNQAINAEYDRTEEVDGLETYVYKASVTDVPIEISDGVPGTFTASKEFYIDPKTGSVVNQVESQERYDSDGNPFLLVDLDFTDEQVKDSVDEAKDKGGQLDMLTSTVPLIGYIVGIPLLLIGMFLTWSATRTRTGPTRRESVTRETLPQA
jgi:hypothetical protein